MTAQSLIHSNAFNFTSFLQGSVDERTGQYSLNIDLPELPSNDLNGPSLPLRLAFNPLNTVNSGFGLGWTLVLSQYNLDNNILDLHTGPRLRISENGPGLPAPVPERKLEQFYFENISSGGRNRYRVAHKSGIVEILEPLPTDLRLALPVRVQAPSGHGINLAYHAQKKGCLKSIVDDTGRQLLAIEYKGNSSVEITLLPSSPAVALYTLEFSGDDLARVVLPTANKARWAMTYAKFGELRCLTRLETPVGATEIIEYQERGHYFPGSRERALPYVTRHEVRPGAGQDNLETTYRFTTNNFLGYNALDKWDDDTGLDNLYRVADRTYRYGSTATHHRDGKPVREVQRVYNRFHLMVEQVTREQGCMQRSETVYHERDVNFADQPKYFQLPKTVTQSWQQEGDNSPARSETTTTEYDDFGNQTLEQQPNGIRTERTYLPKATDPEGFVRHLEQEIVRPADGHEGAPPTLGTQYSYTLLPPVSVDGIEQGPGWLVSQYEEQFRLNADGSQAVLQRVERTYVDEPADSFAHGRLAQELTTRNGKSTTVDYSYAYKAPEVSAAHPLLEVQQVITGFDHDETHHAQKELTLQHSVLIGEPLLNRDDDDVEIEYEYDLLRRVVRETVAPGTDYQASRTYAYTLVAGPGGQASQEQVDVKGVSTLSLVDGLNRLVEARRHDRDSESLAQQQNYRQTYTAKHDGLGYLVEEVEMDWHRDEDVPLKTTFHYDGWGERCKEVSPDQVVHHRQVDPVGNPQRLGPVHREWRESADGKLSSGRTITFMNLFEEPIKVERLTADLAPYSEHQYFYDGLGRKVRELDAERNEVQFSYDDFDRLVDHTLADGAVVHRDYAPHSTEDLPELIQVVRRGGEQPSVLGLQRFDGLDRLVESTTGGRLRTHLYDKGQRQPREVITPKGNHIQYEYRPSVGEEPIVRHQVEVDVKGNFNYDPQNARLMSCSEHGVAMTRDYFSTGTLKTETCSFDGGQPYTMTYTHSLQGKLLSYVDVLGAEQSYEYDAFARLQRTSLGGLVSTFEYDALGRNDFYNTVDASGESPRHLGTRLNFDDFDRETQRTFDFGDSAQVLEQQYDTLDRITAKVLREGDEILREEHFEYDERGRLVDYTCKGRDEYLPVDPYGNPIQSQTFRFDAIDNIVQVLTRHAQGRVDITYHFTNQKDPAQLRGYTVNGVSDEPVDVELEYDDDGNLTKDEEGRILQYDALGRLQSVNGLAYGYDPLDRLVSQEQPESK